MSTFSAPVSDFHFIMKGLYCALWIIGRNKRAELNSSVDSESLLFLQEAAQNYGDHIQTPLSVSVTCFLSILTFYYCVFTVYYAFHIVLCFQLIVVSLWSVTTFVCVQKE